MTVAASVNSTAIVPVEKSKYNDPHKLIAQRSKVWQFVGQKLAELKHVTRTTRRKKLLDAVTRGAVADVMEQIALGADLHARGAHGETALHVAAANGHHHILTILLDRGADVNAMTNDGLTPLYVACEKNRTTAVKLLLEDRARVDLAGANTNAFQPIHIAAKHGYTTIVQMLLSHGAKVNAVAKPKLLTPLMLAAKSGASEVVELLLDKGADPDMEDRDGNTPLHFSCSEGHYRATYVLLTAGADPDMPNIREETPFDVAERNGFTHVTYLLETNGMGANEDQHQPDKLEHAFEQDQQLALALARNRPELAEIIVKNRIKYAPFFSLGCIHEDVRPEDDFDDDKVCVDNQWSLGIEL